MRPGNPMMLVDASIWIEMLAGRPGYDLRLEDLPRFVTCAPVVQEIVQGLRPGRESETFRQAFLAMPVLGDPLSLSTFLAAADIYRQGRRKGYTIRSSVDCLIAAIAIEHKVPVWHRDRDFAAIARFTALETVPEPVE
jgi:predicted nucleic acid-binding protein